MENQSIIKPYYKINHSKLIVNDICMHFKKIERTKRYKDLKAKFEDIKSIDQAIEFI